MAGIFEMVDRMFAGVVPVADFLWDFPTNYAWYSGIPILGQFSLAILLLLGGSFYFTFKFNFVQMKEFKTGLKLLTAKTKAKVGTTQLAAFLISMAGRGEAISWVLRALSRLAARARFSGCGYLPLQAWQPPLGRPPWRRYTRRKRAMNMWGDLRFISRKYGRTKHGWAQVCVSCTCSTTC